MLSIGERIRNARKEAKIKQVELAQMLHVSQSYICDIEHDRFNPSVATLKTIAGALNLDVAEFISDGSIVRDTGMSTDEISLVMTYRSLSDSDKELAKAMLQRFIIPAKSARSTKLPITGMIKTNRAGLASGRA